MKTILLSFPFFSFLHSFLSLPFFFSFPFLPSFIPSFLLPSFSPSLFSFLSSWVCLQSYSESLRTHSWPTRLAVQCKCPRMLCCLSSMVLAIARETLEIQLWGILSNTNGTMCFLELNQSCMHIKHAPQSLCFLFIPYQCFLDSFLFSVLNTIGQPMCFPYLCDYCFSPLIEKRRKVNFEFFQH